MYPTRVVNAMHKHVPLIKFLGPRSKFHKGETVDAVPKLHPAAPKWTDTSFFSVTESQKHSSNSFRSKSISMDYSQLPEKYKRKGPSHEEIEVIELGGADHVIRYKGY